MNEVKINSILEDYIQRRFSSIKELEMQLKKDFKTGEGVTIEVKKYEMGEDLVADYEIFVELNLEDCLIDVTFYFLYDRYNQMYITEQGFEVDVNE